MGTTAPGLLASFSFLSFLEETVRIAERFCSSGVRFKLADCIKTHVRLYSPQDRVAIPELDFIQFVFFTTSMSWTSATYRRFEGDDAGSARFDLWGVEGRALLLERGGVPGGS